MTRKIPILSLEDFETKSKKDSVMKSIVEGITEGIELELESINIATPLSFNMFSTQCVPGSVVQLNS